MVLSRTSTNCGFRWNANQITMAPALSVWLLKISFSKCPNRDVRGPWDMDQELPLTFCVHWRSVHCGQHGCHWPIGAVLQPKPLSLQLLSSNHGTGSASSVLHSTAHTRGCKFHSHKVKCVRLKLYFSLNELSSWTPISAKSRELVIANLIINYVSKYFSLYFG